MILVFEFLQHLLKEKEKKLFVSQWGGFLVRDNQLNVYLLQANKMPLFSISCNFTILNQLLFSTYPDDDAFDSIYDFICSDGLIDRWAM